ncbi:MAG: bifunctional (p)ppGpp synthetase/guanosine-3',5'-bis(diphosphate) 3'-pyrophosphohydrolase [Candidatus Schekmanbacteria bacterium]|nr:bifunctional (p)ppGpp synthetase/guanosine-3',5'-bis(diphosphate) 3'-pyrophosphohydrolase [Candidatus Schekmanbacteria bacterium]
MIRCEDLIEKMNTYIPEMDETIVRKAYVFAAKAHRDQLRASGEPYLSHPLEVASILTDLRMDMDTVAAGILHDTIENTPVTLEEITAMFNQTVALLVDGVTKIGQIEYKSFEERQSENFRKMIIAMAKDIRVVLIKLADRLHNIRTLQYLSETKRKLIAQETLEIYAPIANRLGIGWMKWELEDESLRYLKPDLYYELAKNVRKKRRERLKYIEEVRDIIYNHLSNAGLILRVEGRPKHLYSIYQKMQRRHISFDEVYDLMAFRVITKSIKDCYAALGVVHSLWTPIPGRFKDYIAMPKPNMYQSLHTTVMGPSGNRIEIQIRTDQMHEVAERGIAAHWGYKEGKNIAEVKGDEFNWLQQILNWQRDLKDPKEFMESLKQELFTEEVYVFTPKGEVKCFPRGATVVDFAYSIHTDVGHRCTGARVNGKIVPLKYQMKSGDTVEILTAQNRYPSKDWLNFVITSRAQNKIKVFLREEESGRSLNLGRTLIEKELKKYDVSLSKAVDTDDFKKACSSVGYTKPENLFIAAGYGKISPNAFVQKLLPDAKIDKAAGDEESSYEKFKDKIKKIIRKDDSAGIKIKEIDNILIRFAKCCSPVPGDNIKGFITRGRGVTVHKDDCALLNKIDIDPARRINVEWDLKIETTRPVKVCVTSQNKKGLLAKVTAIISGNNINIVSANVTTIEHGNAVMTFVIEVKNVKQLNKALLTIKDLDGVVDVERAGISESSINTEGLKSE